MFSKNFGKSVLAALLVSGMINVSANNAAAAPETATGTASASIFTPLTFTDDIDLAFGSVVNAAGGGTVVIDNLGARTVAGVAAVTSSTSAGQLTIKGQSNATFVITPASTGNKVSSDTVTPVVDIPITALVVHSASQTSTAGASDATGKLDQGANTDEDVLTVGGTLTFAGTEPADTYTGSYTVDVEYN